MIEEEYDFDAEDPDFKSKTQVKQDMHELRQLGVEIAELPLKILDTLDLSPVLRAAVDDYRRIGHKNALKRQASFIGKLMRKEADPEAIRAQLEALHESRHQATRQFHLVEQWRDRLISNDSGVLNDFFETFPLADRQQLRSLIRSAAKEKQEKKSPSSARKLFKFIQACFADSQS